MNTQPGLNDYAEDSKGNALQIVGFGAAMGSIRVQYLTGERGDVNSNAVFPLGTLKNEMLQALELSIARLKELGLDIIDEKATKAVQSGESVIKKAKGEK